MNPCDTAVLKKTFRLAKRCQWIILEKDAVDEIFFRTDNPRDRLMLELMARGGMRIGEVLKLRMMDVDDCKLFLVTPKAAGKNMFIRYMSRPQASCVIRRKTERKNCHG